MAPARPCSVPREPREPIAAAVELAVEPAVGKDRQSRKERQAEKWKREKREMFEHTHTFADDTEMDKVTYIKVSVEVHRGKDAWVED